MQSKRVLGFSRSENLGFGAFSGPNRPQEGLLPEIGSPAGLRPAGGPISVFSR